MKIFTFLSDLFLKVFRTLKPIFKAVFTTAFQMFLDKIKDVAMQSITRLSNTDLKDDEKRSIAFKDIKAYATEKMLTFNDSDIFLAIEIFHKSLKANRVIK
jgi:hypothetical protein